MTASLDQLSSRLADLESKFSDLKSSCSPSASLSSLSDSSSNSSSNSGSLGCPSLTTSSTLSSEGYAELESDACLDQELDLDDQDIFSPDGSSLPHSAASTTYALSCELIGIEALDSESHEIDRDPKTPRALVSVEQRINYFSREGKSEELGYGNESKRMWNVVAKRRLRTIKKRKSASALEDDIYSTVVDTPDVKLIESPCETPEDSPVVNNGESSHATDNLVYIDSPIPNHVLPEPRLRQPRAQAKKHYTGLGLGLPASWEDESTPRSVTDSFPSDPETPDDSSSHPSVNSSVYRDAEQEHHGAVVGLLKPISLRPMDAMLNFVQTPSPMEDLPDPLVCLSSGYFANRNCSRRAGLGLRL